MRRLLIGLLAAGSLCGQGSIEGQTFNAATGAPLKKVMVQLIGLNPAKGNMPVAVSKQTDDQGNFAFTGLAAGRYQLSGQRQGFLRQSYGSRHFNTNGTPIPLGQDQHLRNAVLKLSPQSVIAGRVVDEDGDPMANVQVRALEYRYRSGKKQWIQVGNGQTSDIGEYRVPNLEPGRYLVEANPRNGDMMMPPQAGEPLPDRPEMVAAITYFPSSTESATASPVDVGVGAEVRGIEIRIRKVQAFRVRGKVIAPGSNDRPAVMVMLMPKDGAGQGQNLNAMRQRDNQFEIRGVTPGSYTAMARMGNGGQQLVGFQAVEVGRNHVDGLVLTLSGGIDIPGTLKVAESDAVVDLHNANVSLRPLGVQFMSTPRAKVGDDGKFALKGVMTERFTINVSGVPDNCFVKSIQYAGQEVTAAGAEPNGNSAIEITLSATAGQVSGSVGDKDGKPVAGAMVALFDKGAEGAQPWNFYTDENGNFTFKGLKPGDYNVLAWEDIEPGAYMDPEFLKKWESRAVEVKIDPSGSQALQLKVISAEETAK
jgi:protocatechuate 3,4-dioxygenase beta subunit